MDVNFIQLKYLATVSSIDILDSLTRTVVLYGKGFTGVEKIIFSGTEITTFVVQSPGELHFELPPPPVDFNLPVRVVVSNGELGSKASSVDLRIDIARASSGFDKVVQKFFKILLTEKGSNFFDLSQGTNLSSLIGSTSPNSTRVGSYVSDAAEQCKLEQDSEMLLASEILTEVNVLTSYFDPRRASINIELEIITADGVARLAEVSV